MKPPTPLLARLIWAIVFAPIAGLSLSLRTMMCLLIASCVPIIVLGIVWLFDTSLHFSPPAWLNTALLGVFLTTFTIGLINSFYCIVCDTDNRLHAFCVDRDYPTPTS